MTQLDALRAIKSDTLLSSNSVRRHLSNNGFQYRSVSHPQFMGPGAVSSVSGRIDSRKDYPSGA